MRKIIDFWKHFWLGVWRIIKQIGSIRDIIALICSWIVLSGVGVGFIGIILKNGYLVGLGGTMVAFWVAPFTPLIPITIAVSMLIQRYVFMDKRISYKKIKAQFKSAFVVDLRTRQN